MTKVTDCTIYWERKTGWGKGGKVAVTHRGAMIARGLGKTQPQRSLLLQWGHCCWGIEKGRSPRVLPPILELPKVRLNGGGAREAVPSTTKDNATCILVWCQGRGAHIPPFPARGTVRGPG